MGLTIKTLENRDAMLQQRLLVNNPVDIQEKDALAIYQSVF